MESARKYVKKVSKRKRVSVTDQLKAFQVEAKLIKHLLQSHIDETNAQLDYITRKINELMNKIRRDSGERPEDGEP